ncbi:hypothetical protein, partial [Streptomyces sp. NBC_01180]|uniref:hypothetical protein n=1 Tax=Streptomyces sp. NBC_01180 TaxID=2903763 RepID=UPI003864665E
RRRYAAVTPPRSARLAGGFATGTANFVGCGTNCSAISAFRKSLRDFRYEIRSAHFMAGYKIERCPLLTGCQPLLSKGDLRAYQNFHMATN